MLLLTEMTRELQIEHTAFLAPVPIVPSVTTCDTALIVQGLYGSQHKLSTNKVATLSYTSSPAGVYHFLCQFMKRRQECFLEEPSRGDLSLLTLFQVHSTHLEYA